MSPELVRRLRNAAAQYRMSQAQLISGMLKLAEKYPDDLEDMASKEENNSALETARANLEAALAEYHQQLKYSEEDKQKQNELSIEIFWI